MYLSMPPLFYTNLSTNPQFNPPSIQISPLTRSISVTETHIYICVYILYANIHTLHHNQTNPPQFNRVCWLDVQIDVYKILQQNTDTIIYKQF